MVRLMTALLALAAIALPATAQSASPIGIWEPDNRESRYAFTYCGEAGDRLCAELIWIREDKQDARNTRYLNTYVFRNARQTAPGRWNGTVNYEGMNVAGTLRVTGEDTMELNGCMLFVLCENIRLNRVE